jgi:hypothetical protein
LRKIAPEDAARVREEISKSESGDPQLKNAVKTLVEKVNRLESYQPILDELDQVRKVVAQKQQQMSQQPGACEPGGAPGLGGLNPTGPGSQISSIIEFIRPYLTPPDPFRELMMTVVKENIELSRSIKNAVVAKLTGPETAPT